MNEQLNVTIAIIACIFTIIGVLISFLSYRKQANNSTHLNKNNEVDIDGDHNSVSIDQSTTTRINAVGSEEVTKESSQTIDQLCIKSDHDIRQYIYKEMENMSLIESSYESLSQKFIGCKLDWIVELSGAEKYKSGIFKVYFKSNKDFSRLEQVLIDPNFYPSIKFIKSKDKIRLVAKIKELDETSLLLDEVELFETCGE